MKILRKFDRYLESLTCQVGFPFFVLSLEISLARTTNPSDCSFSNLEKCALVVVGMERWLSIGSAGIARQMRSAAVPSPLVTSRSRVVGIAGGPQMPHTLISQRVDGSSSSRKWPLRTVEPTSKQARWRLGGQVEESGDSRSLLVCSDHLVRRILYESTTFWRRDAPLQETSKCHAADLSRWSNEIVSSDTKPAQTAWKFWPLMARVLELFVGGSDHH